MHRFSDHALLALLGVYMIHAILPVMVIVGAIWVCIAAMAQSFDQALPMIAIFAGICIVIYMVVVSLLAGRPESGANFTAGVILSIVVRLIIVVFAALCLGGLLGVAIGTIASFGGMFPTQTAAVNAIAQPMSVVALLGATAFSVLVLSRHWDHMLLFMYIGGSCRHRYHNQPDI